MATAHNKKTTRKNHPIRFVALLLFLLFLIAFLNKGSFLPVTGQQVKMVQLREEILTVPCTARGAYDIVVREYVDGGVNKEPGFCDTLYENGGVATFGMYKVYVACHGNTQKLQQWVKACKNA